MFCLLAKIMQMKKQKIETDKAPKAIGPYSQAIKVGGLIFCSGQIGVNPQTGLLVEGGIKEETEQALKNLEEILKAGGSGLEDVVKVEVYLKDINDFNVVNKIYADTFIGYIKPARVTIEASKLPKEALIEISCTVYKK